MGGKTYSYIHKYSDTNFHYSGSESSILIRENNEKVYWKGTNRDYLLYDFGLQIGDSIYVTPNTPYPIDSTLLICDNVDTINSMGINRRRLEMRTVHPSGYYATNKEYWIWGIGSTLGLFNSGHLGFAYTDQTDPLLLCCQKGMIQVYQNNLYLNCHFNTASLKEFNAESVKLYPNPTHTVVHISPYQNIKEIQVYNSNGKQVQIHFNRNTQTVHFDDISKGIYFLKIVTAKSVIIKKIYKV